MRVTPHQEIFQGGKMTRLGFIFLGLMGVWVSAWADECFYQPPQGIKVSQCEADCSNTKGCDANSCAGICMPVGSTSKVTDKEKAK